MRYKTLNGEITVFLTLLFGIVSALLFVIIESALDQVAKYSIEAVTQIGIHSCFAEYNQDLFKYYNLLAIDTSYRSAEAGIEKAADHLKEYSDINFSIARDNNTAEWMHLAAREVELSSYELLSDNAGNVLKDQATSYMDEYGNKRKMGSYSMMKPYLTEEGTSDKGFMESFGEAISKCEEIEDNPAKKVYSLAVSSDILSLCGVESTTGSLSDAKPSERVLNKGKGDLNTSKGNGRNESFDLYLLEHFGNYGEPKENSAFLYDLEYLITGNNDRSDCLRCCSEKILNQRKQSNLSCLFSNEGALDEAENMAIELCEGRDTNPDDVMESLIYAWAYAESVIDVSHLLNSGYAPKEGNSSPVIALSALEEFTGSAGGGGSGENYSEYLSGLIGNTGDYLKRMRVMDLIEYNIQHLGHLGFRVDSSITDMVADMKIDSNLLRNYSIKREYGYTR